MKQFAYTSTTAFLAHHKVLSDAATGRGDTHPLSAEDNGTLDEMQHLLAALTPEERTILFTDQVNGGRISGEQRRRRERAQLKLHRLLMTKGVLRG